MHRQQCHYEAKQAEKVNRLIVTRSPSEKPWASS